MRGSTDTIELDNPPTSGAVPATGGEVIVNLGVSVKRTFDPAIVNEVVNSDDVRPFVGPGGYLDLSEVVARPENWFLMGAHGGFALIWSAPGVHEVHTFILRSGRGKWARSAAQEMIAFAAAHGATMLWTKIPGNRPNVAAYAVQNGMRPVGMTVETFGLPYQIYSMELGACQ